MQQEFSTDIFSVESFSDPVVILLNGEIYSIRNEKAKKVCKIEETVKITHKHKNNLYVVGSTAIYAIDTNTFKIKILRKGSFSKVSAIASSICGTYLGIGTYDGEIILFNLPQSISYNLESHEDSIVGLVIQFRSIYAASEDGIVSRTRLEKTEPSDMYGIKKMLVYMGLFQTEIILIDLDGSVYTMNRSINDFERARKVVPKATYVFSVDNSLYTMHNNEMYKIVTKKEAKKLPYMPMRVEGVFMYKGEIVPYAEKKIFAWKDLEEKENTDDFFEDL